MQHRRRVELDVRLERPVGVLLGEDPQRDVLDLRSRVWSQSGLSAMPSATLRSAAARGS